MESRDGVGTLRLVSSAFDQIVQDCGLKTDKVKLMSSCTRSRSLSLTTRNTDESFNGCCYTVSDAHQKEEW